MTEISQDGNENSWRKYVEDFEFLKLGEEVSKKKLHQEKLKNTKDTEIRNSFQNKFDEFCFYIFHDSDLIFSCNLES